jgi:hypothetical protein
LYPPIERESREIKIARRVLPFFEIAVVLVRFDHLARLVVNANHSLV